MTAPGHLLSFGQFLRARQPDILADWSNAAREHSGEPVMGSARIRVVADLLERIPRIAEATREKSAVPQIDPGPMKAGRDVARLLEDYALLRHVILRRIDAEGVRFGCAECEVLAAAFETALANALQQSTGRQSSNEVAQPAQAATAQRERFLAEASRVLAESLDYEQTMKTVARLAVPDVADWCHVDVLRDDGSLTRVATEHKDPRRVTLAGELHRNPPHPDALYGAPNVVRTGQTEYHPHISDSFLQQREQDPERLRLLRGLGLNSFICAPLVARGRVQGALTFSTDAGRDLTPGDVRMAEDLARRAAMAIDNARLYDAAQRALHGREEVLAIVTHDLRMPLSAVLAGASLLSSAARANSDLEQIAHRAETIRRAAQHMSRLVKDLTDIGQIDTGHLPIERSIQDPTGLVREAVDTLQVAVSDRSALDYEIGSDVPWIRCDRDRIIQVISNLVSNAAKVGASSIVARVDVRGPDVIFSISDTGPGIPAEDIPHMFDRYWRGRNASYKGTGLGLPIANGIVQAHGGRMWVESTLGVGSTFYFSIPAGLRE